MTAARRIVTNSVGWKIRKDGVEILLAEPRLWATLDHTTISDPNVASEMTFDVRRGGTDHGTLVWFDATMAEGVGFSNAWLSPRRFTAEAFSPGLSLSN
jgi:hypothetical protein